MDDFLKFIIDNGGVIALLIVIVVILGQAIRYLLDVVITRNQQQMDQLQRRLDDVEKNQVNTLHTMQEMTKAIGVLNEVARDVAYLSREALAKRLESGQARQQLPPITDRERPKTSTSARDDEDSVQ